MMEVTMESVFFSMTLRRNQNLHIGSEWWLTCRMSLIGLQGWALIWVTGRPFVVKHGRVVFWTLLPIKFDLRHASLSCTRGYFCSTRTVRQPKVEIIQVWTCLACEGHWILQNRQFFWLQRGSFVGWRLGVHDSWVGRPSVSNDIIEISGLFLTQRNLPLISWNQFNLLV